ncbi:SUMF1/EgtB/PvdO family nonheme iron enzyme [uncultured Thiodictyon sp.]|uniref:SUMF1/EgtB/PvdO family nonheme iron enzyme n=1 Tax=uncultured Thiodictyon sp. TaxID=1846217 RepID=UPI0025DD4946|nr:SUMF1/EgtB/PvdO family nonheme iron enzyme [uncultured Thiodictyon sp.]
MPLTPVPTLRAALCATVLLIALPLPALAEKGLLEVTSSPGGAKIYLDGQRKGNTPKQPGKALVLELDEGEYRLEARIDNGGKASEEVFVAAGAIQPVHLVPFAAPAMVRIPAGRFLMGCQPGEAECEDGEKPAHQVSVPAFELGKTEVTFADWDACVADGGCKQEPEDAGWGRDDRPVINVSWDDAQEYLRWLNRKTGKAYRLPTEAEWEYAARAGTTTAFSTGRCISTRQANYNGNYDYNNCGAKTGVWLEKTQPVGSYPSNPWGLSDMHGNVWEWIQDCRNLRYGGAPTNGDAWTRGDCTIRLSRGGSWYSDPAYLRSGFRSGGGTDFRHSEHGFRVARTLTP